MPRPTKYKPEYIEQVKHLCRLGATTLDLAKALSVTSKTIETWMKEHPKFLRTIKESKQDADEQVKKALFKRAIGCHIPDSDIRVIEGSIVITPLEKHFPPETAACMAWLHNRNSDNWKPRKAVDDTEGQRKAHPVAITFNVSERVKHD